MAVISPLDRINVSSTNNIIRVPVFDLAIPLFSFPKEEMTAGVVSMISLGRYDTLQIRSARGPTLVLSIFTIKMR